MIMTNTPFDYFLNSVQLWAATIAVSARELIPILQVPDPVNYPITSLIISIILASCPVYLAAQNLMLHRKEWKVFFKELFKCKKK